MNPFRYLMPAAVLLLAAGCGNPDGNTDGNAGDGGPPALDSPVVATVNGEAVTEALLEAYLRARGTTDPSAQQRQAALQEVVNLVLLRQQAEKQNLDEKPDVQADLALHRLSTLASRQVRDHNAQNPITEADARMEYDRTRDTAGTQEYHVRHILLASREAAQQTIAELDEGADFAELANERSRDNREDAGGDLGWLNLPQLPQALREPIRELEPGEYGREPVQTQFGWHVLKLEDTRELEAPGFEEVKQGVIASLQRQRMETYVQGLREEADIQVTEKFTGASSPAADPTSAPAARPDGGAEPREQEDGSGN